jgi:hypothetical protein
MNRFIDKYRPSVIAISADHYDANQLYSTTKVNIYFLCFICVFSPFVSVSFLQNIVETFASYTTHTHTFTFSLSEFVLARIKTLLRQFEERDPSFSKIHCTWVDPRAANIYQNSRRAQEEFPSFPIPLR